MYYKNNYVNVGKYTWHGDLMGLMFVLYEFSVHEIELFFRKEHNMATLPTCFWESIKQSKTLTLLWLCDFMVLYLSPSTNHIKSSHCKPTQCLAAGDVFPRHSHDEGKIGMRFAPRALRDYFLARCFTRCLRTKHDMDEHGCNIWNIPVRLTEPRCCWYFVGTEKTKAFRTSALHW